jgi:two-component system, NarL family, nitrate/nitrite response regulator NarL
MADDRNPKSNSAGLTDRELQILALIVSGSSTKQIAGDLGISFKTVCAHRLKIMRKVNAHNPIQLVRYALQNRIVEL